MHLTPEQLIDVAERTTAESSVPHLVTCGRCRRELDELRAAMATLAARGSSTVPEPSPLFWARFREGINQRIDADASRAWRFATTGLDWLRRPSFVLAAASAIAILLLALRVNRQPPAATPDRPSTATVSEATTSSDSRAELLNDAATEDDASLQLVAELSTTIDVEAARDAGLAAAGSAEHAVTHMNDDELRELRRLLQQELGS